MKYNYAEIGKRIRLEREKLNIAGETLEQYTRKWKALYWTEYFIKN